MKFLLDLVYYRWKVFVLSMVAVLIMVIIQHLRAVGITDSFPVKDDPFDSVRLKLEQRVNSFHLGSTGFIQTAQGSGDYTQANSYIVFDLDSGQILAQQNLSKKESIASLTKLMTAVVALDLAKPDDVFTISDNAADKQPTKLGLVPGQKLTLEELLNGSLLTSANDAAEVIKEGIDQKYGSEVFISAMNLKAKNIGLKNTHFENPQGFDDSQNYSSAEDLAVLTGYALKNYPLLAQIVQKDYQFYPENSNHKQIDMYNWNGLLDVYPGTFGIKIGNTSDAGYTTIVGSEREGRRLVAIVLGAPGVLERDLWASELLDLGFGKIGLEPVNVSEQQLIDKYATWQYFS